MSENSSITALREFMKLREEIAELEQHENAHEREEFEPCALCNELARKSSRHRWLLQVHGDNWAVLLTGSIEALKSMHDAVTMGDSPGEFQDACKQIEAAIRKAEGRDAGTST
jgi:hypothetical protein